MTAQVAIVGAGRAGVSLATALAAAGWQVHLQARQQARRDAVRAWCAQHAAAIGCETGPAAAPLVVFAVPDRALPVAAAERVTHGLLGSTVWLHLSGAAPWRALQVTGAPAELGVLHPLAALPDPLDVADAGAAIRPLSGATYAVSGTAEGLAAASHLAAVLGGRSVHVTDDAKPLYHAAAAVAANDLVALLAVAEGAATAAGLTPQDARAGLTHLMQTALDAVRRLPLDAPLRLGLTGAVARGDASTLQRHMDALAGTDSDLISGTSAAHLHAALSTVLIELVRPGGSLGPAALAALDAVVAATGPRDGAAG